MTPISLADDQEFQPSYIPKFETPERFIAEKVAILRNHMGIYPTPEEIQHLKTYKTENEINAAIKTIINKYWD